VRSLRRDITDSASRAGLIPVGKALFEAAEVVRSGSGDLGRPLADASGAYSSERSRIRERARYLVDGAESLKKQATNWVATLEGTQDPVQMTRESAAETDRMIAVWEAFVRETEDRRRWLETGLAQAKELRENVAKPGTQLQLAEDEYAAKKKEADERVKRAVSDWFGAKSTLYDAQARQKQAHDTWLSTLQREGPNEFSQRMRAVVDAWNDAHEKVIEAGRRDWDLFVQTEQLIAENRRVTERYIQQVVELRRFLKEMQEHGANRSWQEFSIWKELFEREFGR
jgi:hypothetical protein